MLITNIKALVVVLPVALTMFVLVRPVCLRFMSAQDFARRRNLWLALTIVAFVSPSFWLYLLVAAPLIAWCGYKDSNPLALWAVLATVIPPMVAVDIPVIGINQLFQLNNARILSFAILLPAAWRIMQSRAGRARPGPVAIDLLILAYVLLQLVMLMPYESTTHTVRRAFLFAVDILAIYFVASRLCTSQRTIVEMMAAFCLIAAIQAPLALFEMLKGWLLFWEIGPNWGVNQPFTYLWRAGSLRAEVSAGHAIPLGMSFAIAFGFWLYLSSRVGSRTWTLVGAAWMWMGLIAAYSRAPWLGAVVFLFVYLAIGRKHIGKLLAALFAAVGVGGLVMVTPLGQRILDNLPFIGTVDAYNVEYRIRFAERAWELIKRNPLFGDPFFLAQLEDLRQGQGIIDLINGYATIAMQTGLIGLGLFLAPVLLVLGRAYRAVRRLVHQDSDLALLGANLVAWMTASLFMLATGNLGGGQSFYLLVAVVTGYGQLVRSPVGAPATQPIAAKVGAAPR